MMYFSLPHSQASAALAKADCRCAILQPRSATVCEGPAALTCFEKQARGRRPQRPGNQSRTRVSGSFPPGNSLSRITGYHWLAAIIRLSQELSRFAEPTFDEVVAVRNTKNVWCCEETVEDETSLWKAEEN